MSAVYRPGFNLTYQPERPGIDHQAQPYRGSHKAIIREWRKALASLDCWWTQLVEELEKLQKDEVTQGNLSKRG